MFENEKSLQQRKKGKKEGDWKYGKGMKRSENAIGRAKRAQEMLGM